MLWDLIHNESDLEAQRAAWAEKLREPIRNHPKAWEWVSRPSKKKSASANRRAAKTETTGRESAALAIENDNFEVWVFAGDFSEYSKNWLARRPDGLIYLLQEMGLKKGENSKKPEDFYVVSGAGGTVKEVHFPKWKSAITVFSAKDDVQIQKARGGRFSLIIIDEAQKLQVIQELLQEVLRAASIDFGGSFWLLGTPGKDIDSYFYRVSSGAIPGWDVADFYNWDNPHFGSTFREGYENSGLKVFREDRHEYGLTDDQMEFLENLDEATARDIYSYPMGKSLPQTLLREWFGVWIADQAGLVFGSVTDCQPWWGQPWSQNIDRRHQNKAVLQDLLDEPKDWKERYQQLPKRMIRGKPYPKKWTAIIGSDFGMKRDPFALVVWLESASDKSLYELGSGRALDLGEDEQADILEHWVAVLRDELNITTKYIIVDASGGASASTQKTWDHRFRKRFNVPVFNAKKYDKDKGSQIWAFNADVRRGTMFFLENSPLSIEMEALQWRFTKSGKREIHKHRKVNLSDGSRVELGDNCCDAARYSWFFATHHDSAEWVEPEDPYDPDVIERKMDEQDFGMNQNSPVISKNPRKPQKLWKQKSKAVHFTDRRI